MIGATASEKLNTAQANRMKNKSFDEAQKVLPFPFLTFIF